MAWRALALFAGAMAASPATAFADMLEEGDFVVSVERLYGVTATTQSTEVGGVESSVSTVNWSLLSNPLASGLTVYSTPRLAVDYIIADAWTAGAGAGFVVGSTSSESGGESVDGPGVTGILVSPRGGYLLQVFDALLFWPTAGLTIASISSGSGDTSASQLRVALSVGAPLLVRIAPGVALRFEATMDLGVAGDNSTGSGQTVDATATEFGLQGGLAILL